MKLPLVFLAFANDKDNHLPLLEEERKAITAELIPLASKQYFQLFTEPSATTQDLSRYVAEFKDRILLFHYGGHAESDKIFLADQVADSSGLAQLLGLQSDLKLVFLNGCSTREQVEALFDAGVPAVIATTVPIADTAAREFAAIFYKALATQHTLEEAFKLAAADYLLKMGEAVGIYRGIGPSRDPEKEETLPWGLYIQPDQEEVLQWKLPVESQSSVIVRGGEFRYQGARSINQMLIETIANATMPYAEDVRSLIEDARAKERAPKIRDLRVAVIDSFPTPIGTHLRKLLLSEEISTTRLAKIINVYQVAGKILAFIMMSQLWDECYKNKKFKWPKGALKVIQDYFDLEPDLEQRYNYIALTKAISDAFVENNVEPFIEEFKQLQEEFYQDSKFYSAHLFLEEMKDELRGSIAADEIESFCVQAEDHLCELFKHIGFSAKYTLATVKNIDLLKRRHEQPRYRHHLVILDKITAAFGVLDETIVTPEYTDNQSVVLLKDEEAVHPYLNLSPFIIDENALLGQNNSKLFFFRFRENKALRYILFDNLKDELVISSEKYEEVYTQFINFLRSIELG
ncbi:MAG: CHAT domain-containing protein [Saprospiraceae bacterium]|nr:CHAT domain-containing protein [Saprospiraceae bacterium]